ncbi:MAG: glycoside hydrolase family 27 protein [Lachnospiraceae bacterium]|nr:glycoside hydrolase family 27 protein [Lachnospiraceae bacterium]
MSRKAMCAVPPMGWNSWNTFTENINEDLVKETVDSMKEQGFLEAGYEYVVMDDCWSLKERDSEGRLVADPEKFPNGIKALADYIHEKGFKFGMYSCCGTRTCANYPGSFEHEFEDAKQFAQWGVDYLKYDNCFKPQNQDGRTLYRRMGMALANSGRDIVFSACQWGTDSVHEWIRSSGAHLFRSTEDINDSWNSIKDIALSQLDKQAFSGSYCHNDMDMLVVGMYGKGGNEYISAGGCTDEEYQTHFSLWAMMNSPLMIGCDVRKINDETKKILLNQDIIAINQDIECRSPFQLSCVSNSIDTFVLVKFLSNGDIAVGMFNLGDVPAMVTVDFWDMGLTVSSGRNLEFYDCIEHENIGVKKEIFSETVAAHGSKVYRCKMV